MMFLELNIGYMIPFMSLERRTVKAIIDNIYIHVNLLSLLSQSLALLALKRISFIFSVLLPSLFL